MWCTVDNMRKKMMPDYQGNLDEYRKSLNVLASRETAKAIPAVQDKIREAEILWEQDKQGIIQLSNPEALAKETNRLRRFVKRNPDPKNTKVKGLKRNV